MRALLSWRAVRPSATLLFLLAAAGAAAGLPLRGQTAECPPGNLLAGLRPIAARDVQGDPARATDSRLATEGSLWDSPSAVRLEGAEASLTWDLGAPRPIQALALQADADDLYPLSASLDGKTFVPLAELSPLADVSGLRRRTAILPSPALYRFLRLDPPQGDGFASVSELEAFCQIPAVWPPALQIEAVATPQEGRGLRWDDLASRRWELLLALLGAALLIADRRSEKAEGTPKRKRGRGRLFAGAAVVAALTYFNFGAFHFGGYVHNWDTLHYYLGAKYFRELSYDRLYDCMAVADAAEPRLALRVQHRKITDLRTNVLGTSAEILKHPERCTSHFSPERWRAFRADLSHFRRHESPQRWEEISTDHGFNGTPVWLLAGGLLANTGPATDGRILALTLIDPLYFAAMVAVLGWAFGLRPLAVALLVFATFFPTRFFWTGGAFLRWDWLFYTAAAVACFKKDRPWLAGAALGYAATLRIFPGLIAAGSAVALAALAAREMARAYAAGDGASGGRAWAALRSGLRAARRRPEVGGHLRFLAGMTLATALLVGASFAFDRGTGGAETYRAFLANTRKHQATPLTNHMGLRTVLAYRPSEVGRHLATGPATDPWLRWKEARLAAWRQARPAAALLALAALALLGRAALRRQAPWISLALAVLWIPFAVELTSYYYAFLLIPALLWSEKRWVGAALLALSAFSQLVSFGPSLGMPSWRDEQYTLISLAALLAATGILLAFGGAEKEGNEGAGPVSAGPAERVRPTGRRS